MRCVQIATSDDRMDCRDMFYDPINSLPPKCGTCGFPDLDHVPQPYFLVKSRTMSPNDLAGAANGNFFIRERVRRVFDLLSPDQCTFYPTTYKGTSAVTPWLLAVPKNQVVTAKVNPSIPRCATCGEPRSAHPGTQWSESLFGRPPRDQPRGEGWTSESSYDILKSATWGSSESGWSHWISRAHFMSLRLLHLLKKIKAKGFYEVNPFPTKPTPLDKDESAWIKEKLQLLEATGIPFHAEGTLSDDDAKWFRHFLKSHARQEEPEWDIKAVEKQMKVKLPKSYVDFINSVGPMSFENVDEQGLCATILPPTELDVGGFPEEFEDEESAAVNGLPFATTDHGDCFCFDVQKGKKEYAIFHHKHEYNLLEPYAENFAQCIKRFAGGGNG